MTLTEAFNTGLKFQAIGNNFWFKKVNNDVIQVLIGERNYHYIEILSQGYWGKQEYIIHPEDEFHAQLEKLSE